MSQSFGVSTSAGGNTASMLTTSMTMTSWPDLGFRPLRQSCRGVMRRSIFFDSPTPLLGYCQSKGVRAYDRTEVTAIERRNGRAKLKTDRGSTVEARRIVFATGYESQQYLRRNAGALHSTFAAISEPIASFPSWPGRCLIWETARPYFYLRTTLDDRVIIGGEDVPFATEQRRDGLIRRKTKKLVQRFGELFPGTTFEVAYAWAGTFGETKDGLAYIGRSPERPNDYFALGYGGNGITMSVVAAGLIVDDYMRRKNADSRIYRFGR